MNGLQGSVAPREDGNMFYGSTSKCLHCSVARRETPYDDAILSQRTDKLLCYCPIHIRSIKIAYKEAACRIE
jgi:hypothetical protein